MIMWFFVVFIYYLICCFNYVLLLNNLNLKYISLLILFYIYLSVVYWYMRFNKSLYINEYIYIKRKGLKYSSSNKDRKELRDII